MTEAVLNTFRNIITRKVCKRNSRTALFLKNFFELLCGFKSVSVNRSTGDKYAPVLRLIRRPSVIKLQNLGNCVGKNRTVKRTNCLNIKSCGFLEQCLNLCAELADNVEIISSCFTAPALVCVGCAELSECVSREKHLFAAFIRNENLRPMHHWSRNKIERVSTELQFVALGNCHNSVQINVDKLRQHSLCISAHNELHIREFIASRLNTEAVVRLQMMNNEIIWNNVAERFVNIFEPPVNCDFVGCVEQRRLLVKNNVGIVCHSVFKYVLSFKKVNIVIIYACVFD